MFDENAVRMNTRQRADRLKEAMFKAGKRDLGINKEKLIASLMLDWGVTRRTVLELVNMLLLTGAIREEAWEEGNVLLWNKPIKDAKQTIPEGMQEGTAVSE